MFPGDDDKFVCGNGNKDVDGASRRASLGECSALCCKTAHSLNIITVTNNKPYDDHYKANGERHANIRVYCPKGSSMISGGFFQRRIIPSVFIEVVRNMPIISENGDSGWHVEAQWTYSPQGNWQYPEFVANARCAKTLEEKPLKRKLWFSFFAGVDTKGITCCPNGHIATAVGWHITNRPHTIDAPGFVHVDPSLVEYHSTTGPVAGVTYFKGIHNTPQPDGSCCLR